MKLEFFEHSLLVLTEEAASVNSESGLPFFMLCERCKLITEIMPIKVGEFSLRGVTVTLPY